MDLKLTSGERAISDLHDNEFVLTSEERVGIFSGMDAHIIGMKEGESKSFTTTIPADYGNPDLAGKEASYEVTLKAVKERELPEVNDEFAMTVGDYTTMEQVRDAIREQLRSQRERDANRELSEQAIKALSESSTYNIHPLLAQDEVETMMRETKRSLEDSRLTLEDYLKAMNKSEEEFRKDAEPEAIERVKRDLGLAALADAENVAVDDDEASQWYELMTMLSSGRRERWRDLTASQKRSIIARLRRDKALDRLIEIGTQGKWPPARAESAASGDTDVDAAAANAAAAARAGVEETEAKAETPAKPAKSGAKAKSAGKAQAAAEE
jgi:trigger factor